MTKAAANTCIFLDIGGVVLTDGWGRQARKLAAAHFDLTLAEIDARHHLIWDTYQAGNLTLDDYLDHVVFYERRTFTKAQFRRFMFAQSHSFPEMLNLIARLKARHRLKIVVVSNEGRELNSLRIRKFNLGTFVDSFISSCFVHVLKPDTEIFRLALDISQSLPQEVVYIDDTAMFVQIAEGLGIRGVHHTDYRTTVAKLASFGLHDAEGVH
jgi:putative hydrolase of the HAD superfamily